MAKAVAKRATKKNGILTTAPDFMKSEAGRGSEDVTQDAVEIPRVVMLQALSPEVEEYDVRAGEFFHNIALEELGKSITVVPCHVSNSYMLWRPREDGGGILARAQDGKHWDPADTEFTVKLKSGKVVTWRTAKTVSQSGLDRFGSEDPDDPENNYPAATAMIDVICVMPERPEMGVFMFTFQRSGYKIGKKFNGNLKLSPAPTYGRVFEFSTKKVEGHSGPYYEPRLKPVRFVGSEEEMRKYEEVYTAAKARRFIAEDRDEDSIVSDVETSAY